MEVIPKKVIIVAGEASGDMQAANLVAAIKKVDPSIQFFGLGGEKMQQAGVTLLFNLADLAVVGFVEVLKNLKKIKQAFSLILEKADEIKPDAAILVDYPGFNLRLAKELKKRNIKVIYYISPQIWAWGLNRVKLIKQVVDKMIVVFKFEEELYQKFGVDATFVGHPFLDTVKPQTPKEEFLKNIGLSKDKQTIGLMPGSRRREVELHLPIMLKSAKLIQEQFKDAQFLVIKSTTVARQIFDKLLEISDFPCKITENASYNPMNGCDFLLIASGSATLEAAILLKPMVIIYKVSFLTWAFLKFMLKIPYVGLVNVIAGRKIVPECLQFDAAPEKISREMNKILASAEEIKKIKIDLENVRKSLGSEGASQRAAEAVVNFIRQAS